MPSPAQPICLTGFGSIVCGGLGTAQTVSTVEGRRKALNDLLAEQWEYGLRTSPVRASFLETSAGTDKLDDLSQEAVDKDLQRETGILARFEAIDTSGFPDQEALNKTLMVRDDDLIPISPLAVRVNPASNPNSYRVVLGEELFDTLRGGAKCGPFGSALKNSEYVPHWGARLDHGKRSV